METDQLTTKYRQQLLDDRWAHVASGSEQLTDDALAQVARAFGHLESEYGVEVDLVTDDLPSGVVAETRGTHYPPQVALNARTLNLSASQGVETYLPNPYGTGSTNQTSHTYNTVAYVAAHEYAHALLFSEPDGGDDYFDYLYRTGNRNFRKVRWDVSLYAATTPQEFGAEVFALTHQARHAHRLTGLERWVRTLGATLHARSALPGLLQTTEQLSLLA